MNLTNAYFAAAVLTILPQSVIAAVNGYGGAMMRVTAVYPFAPAAESTTTSPVKAAAV